MSTFQKTPITEVLRRGLRCRCPRCGDGALFERGLRFRERCAACGLLLQRDHGDTWLFLIITDRIPLLFGIAALYFGFRPSGWSGTALLFLAVAVPIVATLRPRQGMALALDYLTRVYTRDASAIQ